MSICVGCRLHLFVNNPRWHMSANERWAMDSISRIAVVEDDPEISRMMADFMTEHGFEVTAARTGRDLDRVMSGGKIDRVILDVGLPGEDGLSICRRLRGKSTVPIIMVTGRDSRHRPHRRAGAWRRRLPAQAVQPARTRRPGPRRDARAARPGTDAGPETPQTLMFEGWRLDMARRQLFAQTARRGR